MNERKFMKLPYKSEDFKRLQFALFSLGYEWEGTSQALRNYLHTDSEKHIQLYEIDHLKYIHFIDLGTVHGVMEDEMYCVNEIISYELVNMVNLTKFNGAMYNTQTMKKALALTKPVNLI